MTTPTPSSGAPAVAPRQWLPSFVTLAALWGASFLFMRLGATEFGPVPTAAVRVALAAVFLLPLMLAKGQWPALRQHWRAIFVIGVINSAIPFALYSWAVLHIETGLSAILNASVPLFGAVIAMAWLGDRISRLRWVGLALGFTGVALLAAGGPGGMAFKGEHARWAVAACLLASCSYGVAASMTRRFLHGVPALASATGSQIGSALFLALPAAWLWPAKMPSLGAWSAIVAMALLCTSIAYVLYFKLIAQAGPSRAIAVTFITPVFAVLYGTVLLGERITPWMLGCAVVIVAGTLLSTGLVHFSRRNR